MNKLCIFTNSEGKLCYMRFADQQDVAKLYPGLSRLTPEEFLDWVMKKDVPMDAVNPRLIEESELPSQERDFRDAWKDNGARVEVDMPKAREIHLNRIREKRNAKLAELDVEVLKNLSKPSEVARLEQEKQALRDLPETIQSQLDAATTASELLKIQPI